MHSITAQLNCCASEAKPCQVSLGPVAAVPLPAGSESAGRRPAGPNTNFWFSSVHRLSSETAFGQGTGISRLGGRREQRTLPHIGMGAVVCITWHREQSSTSGTGRMSRLLAQPASGGQGGLSPKAGCRQGPRTRHWGPIRPPPARALQILASVSACRGHDKMHYGICIMV